MVCVRLIELRYLGRYLDFDLITLRVRVSGFWVPKMEAQTHHFRKA